MSNLDFTPQGYQIQQELVKNKDKGRFTYLGLQLKTNIPVIIQQFQFAEAGVSWLEYEAYYQEVEILKQLHHPLIPSYLDEFETPQGFCLVQEYISASSLAEARQFTWAEIKEIALGVLEILVYLQAQYPPIFHRNIQPKNILVDCSGLLKVYLVNFSYAYQGYEDAENLVRENLGFLPPEQLFNHPLSKASDLYSLGATLICLLTDTKSEKIGKLIDERYQFNFNLLPSPISSKFVNWLKKMVAPKPKNRFKDAATALRALKSISILKNTDNFSKLMGSIPGKFIPPVLGATSLFIAANLLIPRIESPSINANLDMSKSSKDQVNQLLKTGECPDCNLSDIDLRGVNLPGAILFLANLNSANLQGAKLPGAYLKVTNLENAKLQGINLQGAYLEKANLQRANLDGANLQGANLTLTNFQEAHLQGASLQGASLQESNFQGANLRGTILQNADLRYAYLGYTSSDGVNFQGANLANANLEFAHLHSAYLKDANLPNSSWQNSVLIGANLENVNLQGANLQGANLMNANLRNANLIGANLNQADFRGANLEGAIMPDGSQYDQK